MYRKISLEDLPKENTKVWTCTKEGCKVWMRDNFALEFTPTCPVCHSTMVSDMKVLPLLVNSNNDLKQIKKDK